ncbi:MAG: hypothetical protein K0R98_714 [Rickettsiaceae bacterium]|jgi:uncharacterized protein CbrC (UPF0167 family)|nr:hypothetical protein [Rickettsiaceae bacterium]
MKHKGIIIWQDLKRGYGFVRPDNIELEQARFTKNTLQKLGCPDILNKTRVLYQSESIDGILWLRSIEIDHESMRHLQETKLPVFNYYPDPILHCSIEENDLPCDCCGKVTGYLCASSMYSAKKVGYICPWCVANGKAAEKFHGAFNYVDILKKGGKISDEIKKEIEERTPCFPSLQDRGWVLHCNDGCEFHGIATTKDITNVSPESLEATLIYNQISKENWKIFRGDDFLKFICRHCKVTIFVFDPD